VRFTEENLRPYPNMAYIDAYVRVTLAVWNNEQAVQPGFRTPSPRNAAIGCAGRNTFEVGPATNGDCFAGNITYLWQESADGITWTAAVAGIGNNYSENFTTVMLTEDRFFRRIAFCGAQLDARVMQRLQGYRQALQRAGLADPALEILSPERSSLALGAQLLEQVLQLGGGVDAVFFCNDDLAQGALLAANRLGLAVPTQIAIAGFNDLPGSAQMVPPLTTIHTPRSAIGAEAATMLLQLLQGQPVAQHRLDLGYHLVRRAST
jgi:hypothetical protein